MDFSDEPFAELLFQLNARIQERLPVQIAVAMYLILPGESGNVKQATWQLVSSPAVLYT